MLADDLQLSIKEVMIYDAEDELSTDEATELVSTPIDGWCVETRGIRGANEITKTLEKFVHIEQLDFNTHGSPGVVGFKHGDSLRIGNLNTVFVRNDLFRGPGRLLFMGCEIARGKMGDEFLIAAGRHFFKGKGGVVGGSTVSTTGFPSGTRLPLLLIRSFEIGRLKLFKLDKNGNVVDKDTVLPFGL